MNILVTPMPQTVEIAGVDVPINYDWRACLLTILAFESAELSGPEKQGILLDNFYPYPDLYPEVAENVNIAIDRAVWFLNGGKPVKDSDGDRVYSFEKDADFIFAGFRHTHGIDLSTESFHWWVFLALFMDLGGDTTFANLISLRKRIKSGKASKEEKAVAREMGDLIELPSNEVYSIEEMERIDQFDKIVREVQERKKNERKEKENRASKV